MTLPTNSTTDSDTLTPGFGSDVAQAVPFGHGAGGDSGPPPSAVTVTASRNENAIASKRLFKVGLAPFSEGDEPDSITPTAPDAQSLFAQFWQLHCEGEPRKALEVCDRLLEVIDPADADSHLRQINARAIAFRDLGDYRAAYVAHLSARPFVAATKNPRFAGCHFHGLGVTLTEMGEHVRAFRALEKARGCYEDARDAFRVGLVNINTARLLVVAGRPGLALAFADEGAKVEQLRADAEIARAMACEADGNRAGARRAIARALLLLADSGNEATRAEALKVMSRIEGAR